MPTWMWIAVWLGSASVVVGFVVARTLVVIARRVSEVYEYEFVLGWQQEPLDRGSSPDELSSRPVGASADVELVGEASGGLGAATKRILPARRTFATPRLWLRRGSLPTRLRI